MEEALLKYFWIFFPNFTLLKHHSEEYGFLSVNLSGSAVLSRPHLHNTLRHLTP